MSKTPSYLNIPTHINCNGNLLNIAQKPLVMGILNITPDSFFDGGKYSNAELILDRVQNMLADGADVIDIGAYSSRPGATHISEKEETQRLTSALELVRKHFPNAIVSVDTFRAKVAEHAVINFGVDIINDISAGDMDSNMHQTMAKLQVPYIIMHMKGTPQNMQNNTKYNNNIVFEVMDYFAKTVKQLSLIGVKDVIIDPGFGFGKTLDHNYELIKRLSEFKLLELPILVGVSRKSMIYNLLNTSPQDALNGTTILNTMALMGGANILRVHDVKQAKECVTLFTKSKEF